MSDNQEQEDSAVKDLDAEAFKEWIASAQTVTGMQSGDLLFLVMAGDPPPPTMRKIHDVLNEMLSEGVNAMVSRFPIHMSVGTVGGARERLRGLLREMDRPEWDSMTVKELRQHLSQAVEALDTVDLTVDDMVRADVDSESIVDHLFQGAG